MQWMMEPMANPSVWEHLLQDKAESLGPGPWDGRLDEARQRLADEVREHLGRGEFFCFRLALAGAGLRLIRESGQKGVPLS